MSGVGICDRFGILTLEIFTVTFAGSRLARLWGVVWSLRYTWWRPDQFGAVRTQGE
jgi:hypothetical protein